jgi:hypothetical protein
VASIIHKFRTLSQTTANKSEEKALYSLFHQTVQFQTESVQNWQCEKSAKQHSIIIYRQYTNVHRVKIAALAVYRDQKAVRPALDPL